MKITTQKILLFTVIFSLATSSVYAQKKNYEVWKVNYDKGVALAATDSLKTALPFLQKAQNIAKQLFNDYEEELGNTYLHLAEIYKGIGKEPEALVLYLEVLKIYQVQKLENDLKYANVLKAIGLIYRINGDYSKSLETLLSARDIVAKKLGTTDKEYGNILTSIASVYRRQGNNIEAINASETAVTILEKELGKENKKYASALTGLAQIYRNIGQYSKAIILQNEALLIFEQQGGKDVSYGSALFTLAVLKNDISNYKESIPLHIEVLEILERTIGKSHPYYSSVLGSLSLSYEKLGDYQNALKYSIEAVKAADESHPGYATRAQNLAYTYASLGEYDLSLQYYNKALKSMESTLGKEHEKYGKLLNNVGKYYLQIGNNEKAREYFKNAIDNIKLTHTENHPDYGYFVNDYASILLVTDQNDEAIDLLKQNIYLAEKNNRINSEAYFNRQYNLAKAYNKLEDYKNALPLLESATLSMQEVLGNDHSDYGIMLKSLSDTYIGLGNIDKALPLINKSNEILVKQIDQIFKFRSEKEKQSFLKMLDKNFNDLQSIPYTHSGNFEDLNAINLNNQLMLKGLLLNNSKNILKQLATLNDSEIETNIIDYRKLKTLITKVLTQPISERNINVDSLKNTINLKESYLVKVYSTHFDDNTSLIKNWKNSQFALGKKEVAIEFSHFNLTRKGKKTDSIMYVAYLYNTKSEYPEMIPLFEEHQLKKILTTSKSKNELYNNQELYNLIWKPLNKNISKNSTVYYSPSGLLNQVSFSAIPTKNNVLINCYNLVQLSSTDVLIKKKNEPKLSSAFFVGGINYEYSENLENENLIADNKTYNYLESASISNRRGTKSRGESWTYLKGTLTEIENLKTQFEAQGNSVKTLSNDYATEANFKKLSGNSPNILHIATHGFFYENLNQKVQSNMTLSTEDHYRLAEDPLLRSGLILAGANYAWKNNGMKPNGVEEDGILNAMEISNLDLSNTDMVVLSACETGLGDIDGSEGVYGLQRAFKMAGVDIIVMSLWQVPDTETSEFMKAFYGNWLDGQKVKLAFNNAQRKMYNKYKNEPLKWAAFVLFE